MKKSLLALAIVAAASSASAATVYDKDGSSLSVGGRVQAIVYNGHANKAASEDSSLVNSARFNVAGKTKVNDFVTAFAFTEWDASDGNGKDGFKARDQYVGVDFGAFGALKAGKYLNITSVAQSATDMFEEFGAKLQGDTNSDRRSGNFRYDFNGYGLNASASFQTASNDQALSDNTVDIQNGYAVGLGYTFDNVVFGPLSIQAGYDYVTGQNDYGFNPINLDKFKHVATSVAWGNADSGLYLAALYENYKTNWKGGDKTKVKGTELVAGYAFDSGIVATIGYEVKDTKYKTTVNGDSIVERVVPVIVTYKVAPSFKVWGEAQFDAGSTDHVGVERGSLFAAGARYTF